MFVFFFFNDTATTEIYTLSLHDALPIYLPRGGVFQQLRLKLGGGAAQPHLLLVLPLLLNGGGIDLDRRDDGDRKSTRLNSSHANISYAVFCLKKKKKTLHLRIGKNQNST